MSRTPRLRMFAGPNGSGKSTLKAVINPNLLGVYINPDEIEQDIRKHGYINLLKFGIKTHNDEVLGYFAQAPLLQAAEWQPAITALRFSDDRLWFQDDAVNAYFASVAADFIRRKLLEMATSFTFETVMSFGDKIELLRIAQQRGFRTYLYYIATEDPIINISRVRHRVKMGGHPVPEDKIVSRYHRSLELLPKAVRYTHRSYIFDNSGNERVWLAEVTDGKILELKANAMPYWFKSALWDRFGVLEADDV